MDILDMICVFFLTLDEFKNLNKWELNETLN
jgi:hypothetical protein